MDVIDLVMDGTKDYESPRRYYYWSTLAAISAIVKDNVYLDMVESYKMYPNIYVLLYGPSALRKGKPISLALELVSRVDNTRVIDGRSSIEAVISELGSITSREGKTPIKDSCAFMVASELSSSIVGNNQAMDIMTDFYDRNYRVTEWKYRLKNSESARLLNPTITWLSGTNEDLFREFVPEKNLHGGLIGRMFVITETDKHTTNSLMFKKSTVDKDKVISQLMEISKLKGEFFLDDNVRNAIDAWYTKFDKEIASGYGDETGFVGRIEDFVIKIAMLIAIGRRGELEIKIEDVSEATSVIYPLLNTTQGVVNKVKKEEKTNFKKRSIVLAYLASRPECREERSKLLRNLSLQLDHDDLDRVVAYMIQNNSLTIDTHGSSIIYRLRIDRPEIGEWVKKFKTSI